MEFDLEKKLLRLVLETTPSVQRKILLNDGMDDLFSMSAQDIVEKFKIDSGQAEKIASFSSQKRYEKLLAGMARDNIRILSLKDKDYPYSGMSERDSLPPVIFVRGDIKRWTKPGLAVVGTRQPTDYGRKVAYGLGTQAAAEGVPLVSGMAAGIDGAAHRGCLEGGGFTVAVMGCGLFTVFPKEHQKLFEEICEKGVAVSQFAPDQNPDRKTFPIRNKLIVQFSQNVVVVEGKTGSGAGHTARYAKELARKLYALPGRIDCEQSYLPNSLLSQGAECLTDIALPFGSKNKVQLGFFDSKGKPEAVKELKPVMRSVENLSVSDLAKKIYSAVGTAEKNSDELMREVGAELPQMNSALLELELEGLVKQEAGRRYKIV